MKTYEFAFEGVTYLIHVGRNKHENWEIIDRSRDRPCDLWFHVRDMPSCHVVLEMPCEKTKMNAVPRQVIKRCAYLCKIHSSDGIKRLSKCVVMYTTIANIHKTNVVGQVAVGDGLCKDVCV